mmetsp:Transcript_35416/g.56622  ORF Transcript_35416/g.56622 Transcript_35416/m.56622 type:complete len:417 (-) Transcript_35416:74-1324(-)
MRTFESVYRSTPERIAAWIAAPWDTARSACTFVHNSLHDGTSSRRVLRSQGILVESPTRITSSITIPLVSPRTCWIISTVRCFKGSTSFSNCSRLIVKPSWIHAWSWVESDILACSQSSFKLDLSRGDMVSIVLSRVDAAYCIKIWSTLSPPSLLSPPRTRASNLPLSILRTDTSNVPPPISTTMLVFLPATKRPYDIAAAIGSVKRRRTLSLAISPARFVAAFCRSVKNAGTVITALSTCRSRYSSAMCLSFSKMAHAISSGSTPFEDDAGLEITIWSFLDCDSIILKGNISISSFVTELNRLPINLFELPTSTFPSWPTYISTALSPMATSLFSASNNTTDRKVFLPDSAHLIVLALALSSTHTDTHEFVVPRSIPTATPPFPYSSRSPWASSSHTFAILQKKKRFQKNKQRGT